METYNIIDFPLGLREDVLKTEIAASAIVEVCNDVSRDGNSVFIYFAAAISPGDKTILDGIVAAHIPPPARSFSEMFTTAGSSIVKNEIAGSVFTYIGSQSNEIHISTEVQGHYASIKAAIAANPGEDKVFIVHPGDYIEDNPITLNAGTVLISCGTAENTFITAMNPGAAILNYHVKCKVAGFNLRNATSGTGIYYNQYLSGGAGKFSAVAECFITNCYIAIDCDGVNGYLSGGAPDILFGREVVIKSTTVALDKGVYVRRGGQFISSGTSVLGVPPGLNPAVPVAYGYYCTDLMSKMVMSTVNCYFCGAGLYMDNNATSEIVLLVIKYCGNGAVIGSTGTTTRFSVNSLEIKNITTYDITVLATNAQVEVHSGHINDTKILNPNAVRLNMRYYTTTNGKIRQRMLGIISVGTPSEPAKMTMGEGQYDTFTLKVLQCTNGEVGTWSDITADAIEDTGVPFGLFAGTAAGNCLYIGRDKVPVGAKISVLTATLAPVPLGDIVWEYWNGAAWIQFLVMQTQDTEPFYFMENCCISTVGNYHVRFGLKSTAPIVAKSLNGISKKWVRARVVNALPNVPTSEYILAHTNATKIGSDGYTEYYGDARTVKKLTWNLYDMAPSGGTSQTIYYGKKLYSSGSGNNFPPSVGSTLSLSAFVPTDLDNSFPLKVILSVVGSVNGNAELTFRHNFSNSGTPLHFNQVDAPAVTTGEGILPVTQAVTAGVETRVEVLIPVSGINMNPSGMGPQTLWFCVERDALDSYAGALALTQISGYYVSWVDGAHLLAF